MTRYCRACGTAAHPSARFCEQCGVQLAADAAAPPPTAPVPAEVASAPARPSWFRDRLTVGVLVTTLAVLGVSAGVVLTGGSDRTLSGTLTLADDESLAAVGSSCNGENGFDDISTGAQVVVADESGTTLATSSLGRGTWVGDACIFPLSVEEVPEARFYRLQIGNERRGRLEYSFAELEDMSWSLDLTLGA